MAKAKRHKLVVTITHNKPVTRADAVRMFREQHCVGRMFTNYYPSSGDACDEAWIVAARSLSRKEGK